jgi:hypothetical protein
MTVSLLINDTVFVDDELLSDACVMVCIVAPFVNMDYKGEAIDGQLKRPVIRKFGSRNQGFPDTIRLNYALK